MGENMKTAVLLALTFYIGATLMPAQLSSVPTSLESFPRPKPAVIPQFLIYRHFLAWANDLDNKAVAAHATDPYEFAKPFKHARLETSDLDAVRKEAKLLDSDLTKHDAKAKGIIAEYRHKAQKAMQSGGPLPPTPVELHQLQAARTALLVQHMVNLQAALGPTKSVQSNAYLEHEIMPHVSLKPLLHSRVAPATAAQSLSFKQQ
jgi:hypothetical protein